MHTCYVRVPMDKKSTQGSVGSFAQGLTRLQSRCLLGCTLIWRPDQGSVYLQVHSDWWQIPFPVVCRTGDPATCWLVGPWILKAAHSSLPQGSFTEPFMTWQLTSTRSKGELHFQSAMAVSPIIMRLTSQNFSIFHWLEVSYRSCLHSGAGDCAKAQLAWRVTLQSGCHKKGILRYVVPPQPVLHNETTQKGKSRDHTETC